MRKRKKNKQLLIKTIIFSFLFFSIIAISYSIFNTQLNIFGTITGSISTSPYKYDPNTDIRLSMSTPTSNRWYSSPNYMYHYNFNVTNVGTSPLAGFELEIKFNHNISSIDIWNYEYKLSGNTLTILAPAKALNPNGSVEVSFIVGSSSSLLAMSIIKFTGIDSKSGSETTASELPITFSSTNGWGNYNYQYNVVVTNKTGNRINGWSFEILLPSGTTRTGGWSAEFINEGSKLIISNLTYNGVIENNGSVSFGFQVNTNIQNYIPEINKRTTR